MAESGCFPIPARFTLTSQSVDQRISLLADLLDAADVAHHVRHSLGLPSLYIQPLGDLLCTELSRQFRQVDPQIVSGLVALHVDDVVKYPIFDDKVARPFPASSPMTWVADFVDLDHRRDDAQVAMRKHACEVEQLVEQIEKAASSRAKTLRNDLAILATQPDQFLADYDRLDDIDLMCADQFADLVSNRRER